MGIDAWSTTAASNNASPPDGAPEGMPPGTVNNTMRQIMASVRAWFEDPQWINLGYVPTRVDGDTFTIPSDVTAIFHVGRRLKATGSATGYATITATTYSAPNTTVDVTMDSGSLPVTLTSVYVSILSATNTAQPAAGTPTWTGAASGGSLTLSTPLAVASGGTGTTTVAGIRSAIGVSATASDTTYAFRANNLSDLTSAAAARSNLGLAAVASTGSAANLTGTLPDASFPSTLPAVSGSALTNINASNLASGTVANARLPNAGAMPGITIQADPTGTPSGAVGAIFYFY